MCFSESFYFSGLTDAKTKEVGKYRDELMEEGYMKKSFHISSKNMKKKISF